MKRVINYTRVSTEEQANGYSHKSQLAALRKYAEEHNLEIVAEFSEDFTGSVPIEFRPEGKKVFELMRSGAADAISVYTIDRLVRPPEEGDEWDMPILIRSLAKLGKEIHTTEDGQLKTDFASLLIAMLKARSAGDERRKIIERTSRGRKTKAKENLVVGGGYPPYGYVYCDDRLVIFDAEAQIVRFIYQWKVESHLSVYAIAIKLSEMGLPTPLERHGKKVKHPGHWSQSAVHRILRSETYIGKLHYGKRIGKNGNGGKRDHSEIIVVDVPAIIPEDVWKAAQRVLDYSAAIAPRNRKKEYLLSGMVRCGCGRAMHPQMLKGTLYYRCSEHAVGPAGVKFRQCHEPLYRGALLEEKVWDYVYDLLHGDFEADLKAAQKFEQHKHQPILAEIDVVKRMLDEVDQEAGTVARAFSSASGIVAEKLKQEMTQINQRHADLTMKLASLRVQIEHTPLAQGQVEQLREFRQRVLSGLDHAPEEGKRKLYEILQVRATVREGHVQISCVIESSTLEQGG